MRTRIPGRRRRDRRVRSRRTALAMSFLGAVATLLVAAPGPGFAGRELTADLGGRRIALDRIPEFHCHDLDYPHIHCYRTSTQAEAAVSRIMTQRRKSAGNGSLNALAFGDYVRAFEHTSYGGSSIYFSTSWPDLRSIGWHDRISSYMALNGETGTFYEHIYYGGAFDPFCCNQQVSSLGALNDTFSSVKPT